MIRRQVAGVYFAVSRWKLRLEPLPPEGVGLLIGAPHTSNWDFILMLAITWRAGISAKFLGKHTLFSGPFGSLMRALGGIPVDRSNPRGLVEDIIGRVKAGEHFYLVVTPEGTRSKVKFWKSGFYRIAIDTGLPVTLGYVDRTTMTTGLGPTLHLTGDVRSDMDRIREFYADKAGFTPERRTEPRLPHEDSRPRME